MRRFGLEQWSMPCADSITCHSWSIDYAELGLMLNTWLCYRHVFHCAVDHVDFHPHSAHTTISYYVMQSLLMFGCLAFALVA